MKPEDLAKLTAEEKRIKIAEMLGYHDIRTYAHHLSFPEGTLIGLHPKKQDWHRVPDYLNDLNAIHEAEKTIPRRDRLRWWNRLSIIVGDERLGDFLNSDVICATAAQRADAFLLTMADTEAEANAEFIVRACNAHYELLAALQAILSRQGEEDPIHGTSIKLPFELEAKARAAIAKAQGE